MGIAKVCSPATETKGGDRKSEVNAGGGSVRSPGAAAVQALRGGGAPRAALRGRRRRNRLGRTREALPPPFMGREEHACRGRGGPIGLVFLNLFLMRKQFQTSLEIV
jgi:hypothetical protein